MYDGAFSLFNSIGIFFPQNNLTNNKVRIIEIRLCMSFKFLSKIFLDETDWENSKTMFFQFSPDAIHLK